MKGNRTKNNLFFGLQLPCIWNDPAVVRLAFETTLGRMKLDYLDMYMIESPISVNREHYRALGGWVLMALFESRRCQFRV